MDEKISFLNRLKLRLNKYVNMDDQKKEGIKDQTSNYNRLPTFDVASLRARMLSENVSSGMALEYDFCENSGAYIEFSIDGMYSFHIYPTMYSINKREEPKYKESIKDFRKEKKSIATQYTEIKV